MHHLQRPLWHVGRMAARCLLVLTVDRTGTPPLPSDIASAAPAPASVTAAPPPKPSWSCHERRELLGAQLARAYSRAGLL